MTTPGQGRGGRGRRIAVVLVPGVGEELATETSRAVAEGLLAQADGYSRGGADAVDVVVPGGGGRPRELYRADRLSLRRGTDEIDLVEMAGPTSRASRRGSWPSSPASSARVADPGGAAAGAAGAARRRLPRGVRPRHRLLGDRELIAWLHGLLRAPEPRDPRGYVIEDATSAG